MAAKKKDGGGFQCLNYDLNFLRCWTYFELEKPGREQKNYFKQSMQTVNVYSHDYEGVMKMMMVP